MRHLQDSGANTENSTEKMASLRQRVLILREFCVVVYLFFICAISLRQRFISLAGGICLKAAVTVDMVRNRNIVFDLVAPGRGDRFGDVKAAVRRADNDRYLLARTDDICIDRCPEQIAVALVRGTAEKRPCAIVQQAVASDLFLHLRHHTGIWALRVDLKILIFVQVL